MEMEYSEKRIKLDKELNDLDNMVIDFTSALNMAGIRYVVVSGYVAILFGRSRSSEDIDILTERVDSGKFGILWKELLKEFHSVVADSPEEAYNEYLTRATAIRFSRGAKPIPNVELKFADKRLDFWSIENRKEVLLNGHAVFIAPLELQIPFKLFLGSEKDIEDAKHLYIIFRDRLDRRLFERFANELKVKSLANKYLL